MENFRRKRLSTVDDGFALLFKRQLATDVFEIIENLINSLRPTSAVLSRRRRPARASGASCAKDGICMCTFYWDNNTCRTHTAARKPHSINNVHKRVLSVGGASAYELLIAI